MRGLFLTLISLLALFAAQWWMAERQDGAIYHGELHDSDSYMRLVRVGQLIESGDWHDHQIPRANAPHGHSLHWSRPLDALLLAGAAMLAPSLGWTAGLHQAGVWISPVLHIFTLLALLWAARPLLPASGLMCLGLLLPLQLYLGYQFAPGRPDHHGLILLLFVLAMGAQIRLLTEQKLRWAAALGISLGLLVWVSVEGLLAATLALAILILHWFRNGQKSAGLGLVTAAGTAMVSILAVLAEHPSGDFLMIKYDQISIVYTVFFMLFMIAFAIAAWAPARWIGIIAFAAVPAMHIVLFPGIIRGPLAGQDPAFAVAIFNYAGETDAIITIRDMLLHLGPALLAVPYGLWRLRRADDPWPWGLLTAGLAIYLPLAIMQMRWAPYVALLALPGYCAILLEILKRFSAKAGMIQVFGGALAQTAVILIFAFGFLLLSAQMPSADRAGIKCPQDAMARHLAERFPRQQRILSYMTIGPAILYRSPHEVIATPYFRNAQGGLDTLRFFRAKDVTAAFEIADRRQIDLVLTCPADRESRLYGTGQPRPIWLKPLPLPAELDQWYRLYRVLL